MSNFKISTIMKTINFITAMLLSVCLFIGCNNENEEQLTKTSSITVKTSVSSKQAVIDQAKNVSSTNTSDVVFTEEDIVSYNGKTGEIQFKQNVFSQKKPDVLLDFYVNDQFLFSLYYRVILDTNSALYNVPLLHYSSLEGDKYYIRDGYPWGLPIDDNSERTGQAASVAKERRANADKILSGWKQFVDELKKEGKYVEN